MHAAGDDQIMGLLPVGGEQSQFSSDDDAYNTFSGATYLDVSGNAAFPVNNGALCVKGWSAADTLVSTPQTISIALGAALVAVVDYRVLIVAMGLVTGVCGAFMTFAGAPDDHVVVPAGPPPGAETVSAGRESVPIRYD